MSLLDWVEVGAEAGHKNLGMNGSFGVAIGDVVNGIFGARHTHIFGGEIKLVTDPEDLALGQLSHKIPIGSALLAGIGGQATFVYAQNVSATYGGPKVDIRRAESISKQSDNVLPVMKKPVGAAHVPDPASEPEASPIDKATCIAVSVLSVLANLVPAVLELVIRFKYPAYGSATASSETLEGYGETPAILKLCAFAVTSRLMALLVALEEAGSWADFAKFWAEAGEAALKRMGAFVISKCLEFLETFFSKNVIYAGWRAQRSAASTLAIAGG